MLFGAVRPVLKLTVSVSIGRTDGRVYVAVPGVGRYPAASSGKEDVETALNFLLGSDLVGQLEMTGCGDGPARPGDRHVLQRYHREGRFQPTRRLKHRTLYLAEPQRCFYCQRALPRKGSAAQRCYTPRDFSPRLCAACGDGRADCPQTFQGRRRDLHEGPAPPPPRGHARIGTCRRCSPHRLRDERANRS